MGQGGLGRSSVWGREVWEGGWLVFIHCQDVPNHSSTQTLAASHHHYMGWPAVLCGCNETTEMNSQSWVAIEMVTTFPHLLSSSQCGLAIYSLELIQLFVTCSISYCKR